MSRQEDFFNEATKQIRDSYVFQNDETYSDDDVRDVATSLAEYGYQYALQHPQWIPVEERHPEENTAPLVRMDLTDKFGEETVLYDVVVFDGNGFHTPYKITHWMEIVPPRKEG